MFEYIDVFVVVYVVLHCTGDSGLLVWGVCGVSVVWVGRRYDI